MLLCLNRRVYLYSFHKYTMLSDMLILGGEHFGNCERGWIGDPKVGREESRWDKGLIRKSARFSVVLLNINHLLGVSCKWTRRT